MHFRIILSVIRYFIFWQFFYFPVYLSPASSSLLCQTVFIALCTSFLVFIFCGWPFDFAWSLPLCLPESCYWQVYALPLILPVPFCTVCLISAHLCMTLYVHWIKALVLLLILSLFSLHLGPNSNLKSLLTSLVIYLPILYKTKTKHLWWLIHFNVNQLIKLDDVLQCHWMCLRSKMLTLHTYLHIHSGWSPPQKCH